MSSGPVDGSPTTTSGPAIPTSSTFVTDPDPDGLAADPIPVLLAWLPRNEDPVRPLMNLATVDADGYPDARHVLLSRVDEHGLVLHTDSRSRKALSLEARPRAVASLVWPQHGRQLVVVGDVARSDAAEEAESYARRSRYLQLLAWRNQPEAADQPQAERQAEWAAFDAANPELEPPSTWAGFRIAPRRITFWRGDPAGPSNRTEYRRTADGWTREHLPG